MEGTQERRRLATILAADVVGYSGLMARDEEATVRALQSYRKIIDRLIERHEGRIFNTGGDSVLAEFGSAVEAVRCAITIQDELRVRNAELAPERRMHFRIGINVGDVIVAGDDLLGDGVNIAARLEGIAEPGGICISGSTFEQVKNKLSVGFKDLGPQTVKNIPEPIAAFGITAAPVSVAGAGPLPGEGPVSSPPDRRSRIWIAAGAAAVVALGAIAVVELGFREPGRPPPKPLSAFPDGLSTDRMAIPEIEALMAGVTISGERRLDEQPFEIVLNPDGSLNYSFGGVGAMAGETRQETGKWWGEEGRFCLQVPQFSRGEPACPRIVKNGGALAAVRPRDGEALPWTLTK